MHDRAVPAATNPLANDHWDLAHQQDQGKLWTPDRGAGFYQTERERYQKPALVSTGKHAGRSRVRYIGLNTSKLLYHIWKRGYGVRYPTDCWLSAWILALQSIWAAILNAITLGIIFARISQPKQRARTIFISDSACIARRDGILKFMFRVADIRKTQVIAPSVRAFLYTWGGRKTAEGEKVPVRIEELDIGYIDGMLLLPLVVEHSIDERSPLYGHTYESLRALGAEVIVTFEGTSESGAQFMTRQSYLPSEMHWGYVFSEIIFHAKEGETEHSVDISRFHEIQPQTNLKMLPPAASSRKIVSATPKSVPYPVLQENTLVLSNFLVVGKRNGKLSLMFRVGDTYPNQMLQVQVRAYFYRWKPHTSLEGEEWPFTAWELKITDGLMSVNQLLLRMPTTMVHVIDDDSPLAAWRTGRAAVATDSDSEIVVVVEATMYSNSSIAMKQRTYNVCNDVKYAHRLIPIVTAPNQSPDGKPRVLWSKFHDTVPVDDSSAAGRAGSISIWPEQGQLPDPAGASSTSADGDSESDATATITATRGRHHQRSSNLRPRPSVNDDDDDDECDPESEALDRCAPSQAGRAVSGLQHAHSHLRPPRPPTSSDTGTTYDGSAPNPYSGDGAWAVQALLQQAAQVVQQCKQVDTRARQAADLLSSRDDFIAAFVQEHGMLVQLTAHIGSTAREMQQKRVIAGFTVPHAEKKGLVQRLALVDHTLSRFNRELDNQEKQIRKLQAEKAELQFYGKLHANRPPQQARRAKQPEYCFLCTVCLDIVTS
ncbi:hypothetical protein ABBQ38_001566 [Trebouxia sp. C0009 RCD-2024]